MNHRTFGTLENKYNENWNIWKLRSWLVGKYKQSRIIFIMLDFALQRMAFLWMHDAWCPWRTLPSGLLLSLLSERACPWGNHYTHLHLCLRWFAIMIAASLEKLIKTAVAWGNMFWNTKYPPKRSQNQVWLQDYIRFFVIHIYFFFYNTQQKLNNFNMLSSFFLCLK